MPRLAAIEWNQDEVRLAVANVRGGDIVIDHLQSATLAPPEPGQLSGEQIQKQIADLVGRCKATRAETIVVVDRTGVEVRSLTVPRAPDDELPDMVRFQALQHFSTLNDDWPLDFQPISSPEDTACTILAATISPQRVDEITDACENAELRLKGIVTRPCAMASLAVSADPDRTAKCQLIVNVLGDDADLAVLHENTVFLTRTVRLSTDWQSDLSVSLPNEIRRTLAAVQTQSMGQRIEEIVLCGIDPDDEALRAEIASQTNLPVALLDPLKRLRVSKDFLRRRTPDRMQRFAPLLGVLLCEVEQPRQIIDFLRPRRRAKPTNRRPLLYTVAALAAGLILMLAGATKWQLVERDREIANLRRESSRLDKNVEAAQKQTSVAMELDRWYLGSVNWLVELGELSKRLPSAEELRIEQLQADQLQDGGLMQLKGYVDKSATVTALESSLRDGRHSVTVFDRDKVNEDPAYPWYFSERILVVSEQAQEQLDSEKLDLQGSKGGAAMNKREKMLAIAVGGLLAIVTAFYVYGRVEKSFKRRNGQLLQVKKEIDRKEQLVRRSLRDGRRLAEYEDMSLPADGELARSQYQAWLSEIVDAAALIDPQVKVVTQSQLASGATQLTCSINGEADLDQVTRLLYDFYAVNTIHRIRRCPLKPIEGTNLLQVNMTVDALILPTATKADFDSNQKSPFASQALAEYAVPILQRNLFAPPNSPPSLDVVSSQRFEVGKTASFRVNASDPDGSQRFSYSMSEYAPEGATIDPDSGEFRWTPTELGEYEFAIGVSDGGFPSLSDEETVTITVVAQSPVQQSDEPLKFDEARFTYAIAMTEVQGQRQLWLQIRTKNEIVKVAEGDTVDVGSFSGKVTRIGARDAELVADGATVRLGVGEPLKGPQDLGGGGS